MTSLSSSCAFTALATSVCSHMAAEALAASSALCCSRSSASCLSSCSVHSSQGPAYATGAPAGCSASRTSSRAASSAARRSWRAASFLRFCACASSSMRHCSARARQATSRQQASSRLQGVGPPSCALVAEGFQGKPLGLRLGLGLRLHLQQSRSWALASEVRPNIRLQKRQVRTLARMASSCPALMTCTRALIDIVLAASAARSGETVMVGTQAGAARPAGAAPNAAMRHSQNRTLGHPRLKTRSGGKAAVTPPRSDHPLRCGVRLAIFGLYIQNQLGRMAALGGTRAHAAYFDSLLDMIPPQHYFEPENEPVSLQHLKKADRLAAKRVMRQEGRKAKRRRLDPSAAVTSLQVQQSRAAQKAQAALEEAQEDDQQPAGKTARKQPTGSTTPCITPQD